MEEDHAEFREVALVAVRRQSRASAEQRRRIGTDDAGIESWRTGHTSRGCSGWGDRRASAWIILPNKNILNPELSARALLELAAGSSHRGEAVRGLKNRLGPILAAHTMLATKGRVVVTGMANREHRAQDRFLRRVRERPRSLLRRSEHGDLGRITEHDVVVAISY